MAGVFFGDPMNRSTPSYLLCLFFPFVHLCAQGEQAPLIRDTGWNAIGPGVTMERGGNEDKRMYVIRDPNGDDVYLQGVMTGKVALEVGEELVLTGDWKLDQNPRDGIRRMGVAFLDHSNPAPFKGNHYSVRFNAGGGNAENALALISKGKESQSSNANRGDKTLSKAENVSLNLGTNPFQFRYALRRVDAETVQLHLQVSQAGQVILDLQAEDKVAPYTEISRVVIRSEAAEGIQPATHRLANLTLVHTPALP